MNQAGLLRPIKIDYHYDMKNVHLVRLFILIGLAFCWFISSILPASAIEYGGFGGRPAYPRPDNPRTESIFIHTLDLGTVKNEGVIVLNNTAERKTLMLYTADSTPSTGGGFACKQFSEPKDDVGAWIRLKKTEVILNPGVNEIVPFTISVPKTASVGEHNGCVLIQEKKPSAIGQGGVSLSIRTGLRVVVTIPGEISRNLEIAGFTVTPKNSDFILYPQVKNTGNVSIDADVQVATKYFFGLTLAQSGGKYPILRGETANWNFELKKPFWGGWYRSAFTVFYDGDLGAGVGVSSGKALTRLISPEVWFFSFPDPFALIIESIVILLIAAAIWFAAQARRKKILIKKTWVNFEIKSGDNINSLSNRFGVTWQLLASVNKLKPPYVLQSGKQIKVPPFVKD